MRIASCSGAVAPHKVHWLHFQVLSCRTVSRLLWRTVFSTGSVWSAHRRRPMPWRTRPSPMSCRSCPRRWLEGLGLSASLRPSSRRQSQKRTRLQGCKFSGPFARPAAGRRDQRHPSALAGRPSALAPISRADDDCQAEGLQQADSAGKIRGAKDEGRFAHAESPAFAAKGWRYRSGAGRRDAVQRTPGL